MNLRNRLMGGAVARAPNTDAGGTARPAGMDGQVQQRMARFIPTTYDAATRSVEAIFSTGARRQTWYGFEELDVSPEACDISRVGIGQVKALDHHNDRQINAIVGTVPEARFEGGNLVGRIVFAETDLGRLVEGMVARGELSGISCGYTIEAMEIVGIDEGRDIWRVSRWTLCEVSFVSVPADANAGVRSAGQSPGDPASATPPQETTDMRHRILGGVASAALNANTDHGSDPAAAAAAAAAAAPPVQTEQRTHQPAPVVPAAAAQQGIGLADGLRLLDTAATFGDAVQTEVRGLISDPNQTVASIERAMLFSAARAQQAQTGMIPANTAGRAGEEGANQREGMIEALVSRMTHTAPTERGRPYRGVRISQMMAERNGIQSRDEIEIIERSVGMHTTSDFPTILGTAANRVLLSAYQQAQPIYRTFAARRNFQDFRPHAMLRIGEFPMLEELTQSGEIKHGSIPDSGESVGLKTRARNIALTRQALINDDLGAFSDMAAGAGRAAARTEDKVAFDALLANSGNGLKLADGKAFFDAAHGNLAASGGAIAKATVSAGRTAIRQQKGIGDEILGYAPKILLVGPTQETEAETFLAQVNATTQAEYNPFAGKLTLAVSARITDNSWRLFTDPNELAAFVYGYLRDAEAPMVSQHEPYNQDGFVWKVVHDFAFGAVDPRAGYKNAGQ